MTKEELARVAGTTPEKIDALVARGMLALRPGDDPFREEDIHRVRFAEALDQAGVSLDDIGRLIADGLYSIDFIEGVFPGTGWPLLDKTFGEVADEAGLPWDVVQRLYANWSLPPPSRDQPIREDDEVVLRERAEAARLGRMDPDAIVAASRYLGDNIRRMAGAQVRAFVDNVMRPMREGGMSPVEVLEAIGPIAVPMQEYGARLRNWLYDRQLEAHIFQAAIEILEEILEEAGYAPERSARVPAIAFLDVSGYTRRTEESGDDEAADLAARLAELVSQAARAHGGELVKFLGDGVMFHFTHPTGAVACGLELVDSVGPQGLPPARVGVSAGPVVFRDGDYFGRTVNVAARITDYARPGEVLVSETVCRVSDGARFEPIGEVILRGLVEPLSLFRAFDGDGPRHPPAN